MYAKDKLLLPDSAVELEPWRKALLDAAERLRVYGHCKGRFNIGGARPSCAVGAIMSVTDDAETRLRATRAAEARIGMSLVGWNDAPDTTAEMVIVAFEAAARAP